MSDKRGKYQGLSFPKNLINEVQKYIKDLDEYKSVTEFFRASVREKMLENNQKNLFYKKLNEILANYKPGDPLPIPKNLPFDYTINSSLKNSKQNSAFEERLNKIEKTLEIILKKIE